MKKTTLTIVLASIIVLSISANSFTIGASDIKSGIDDQEPTPKSSRVCNISGWIAEVSIETLVNVIEYQKLLPVAGATVHCINIGGSYNEIRITDENGDYSFENVPVHLLLHKRYLIYVEKEGYRPLFTKPITSFALIKLGFSDEFFPLWPPLMLFKKIFNP